MAFFVPRSRLHEYKQIEGGSVLPDRPRLLVGGAKIMDTEAAFHSPNKVFAIVDTMGIPLLRGGKQLTYNATGPSSAAKKAFNGWWRIKKHSLYSDKIDYNGTPDDFKKKIQTIDNKMLSKSLLVRVAPIGGGSVRSYLCDHILNTNPNQLELKGGMVATTRATYVKDTVPEDTILLESDIN